MGTPNEHAVIVEFKYGSTDLSNLFSFEDELIEAVQTAGVGECDGHEIAMDASHGRFYLYGSNAAVLWSTIRALVFETEKVRPIIARLRYGRADDKDATQVVVAVNPDLDGEAN